MNSSQNVSSAAQVVIWGGLVLGLVLGAAGQTSRFCVRGAIADWVVFRGPARLVSWLLAVALGCVGIQALISLGLFEPARVLSWSTRFVWLSYITGGLLFGVGMVLAGGCPQRSLVKAGEGNLRALMVLIMAALVSLMTIRGVFAEFRAGVLDRFAVTLPVTQDLGSLASTVVPASAQAYRWFLAVVLLCCAGWLAWRSRRSMKRFDWMGAVVVGLLVPASLLLTGYFGFVAEHPETLEPAWLGTYSKRPEGLSFTAPLANVIDLLTFWTDKATVATFGVMLVSGVLVGSFASARLRGTFRLESFSSPRDLLTHMAGAALMGFGGVTALGCSIGQGVTGLAMLSAGSVLAVIGMVGGAVMTLAIRTRRSEKRTTLGSAAPA